LLSVDIWSDIACPWCYLGKRRFEAALAQFAHRDAVEVRWRAFELDPRAPRERDPSEGTHAERIARKYGATVAQIDARHAQMRAMGEALGIDLRFDLVRGGNSFDAHRLIQLGRAHGRQGEVKDRLLRAYFTEGAAIGRADVLAPLAAEAGLDRAEVEAVLAGDRFAREVRSDETVAQELGVTGVPCFVIANRYAVSGAQTPEVILGALDRAWAEHASA
jgi:predicted DsbA family dithiol-disulfide isomerase